VPHAGAAIPVLADRIAGHAALLHTVEPLDPEHFFAILHRLFYDLAGFPLPRLAPALLQIADPGHILYGSDWPFTALATVHRLAAQLETTPIFDDAARRRVLFENAHALFPRLGGYAGRGTSPEGTW
jgi:predicted TIM-barrel fold metal-dependent hydrolase